MPIFGSKLQIPIDLKSSELFDMSKKCKKLALSGPENDQSVTY